MVVDSSNTTFIMDSVVGGLKKLACHGLSKVNFEALTEKYTAQCVNGIAIVKVYVKDESLADVRWRKEDLPEICESPPKKSLIAPCACPQEPLLLGL